MRYPSDLTDEERALIERLMPPATRRDTKRTVNLHEIAMLVPFRDAVE